MKNGLYSFHMHMLDGVTGRDSGVLFLRDGNFLGGGPCFWSVGSYTYGNGIWKGELRTNQHTSLSDPFVRTLSGGGSRQRVFRDFCRRPGRGVRHQPDGHEKLGFSGYLEMAGR